MKRNITKIIIITTVGLVYQCTEPAKVNRDTDKIMRSNNTSSSDPKFKSSNTPETSPEQNEMVLKEDISLERLLGKYDPSQEKDFVEIPEQYATKPKMQIRKEVWEAFLAMYSSAAKDGISLKILSATRNFDYQKTIWERKFGGKMSRMSMIPTREDQLRFAKEVLMFSSMPGTSRHHWGSDIDINSLEPAYFDTPKGQKEYNWLVANAPEFGFCQTYTHKGNGRTGYEEEKWHWSYMPIAQPYLDAYKKLITPEMICCFWGSDLVKELNVIEDYVLGINDTCQTHKQ